MAKSLNLSGVDSYHPTFEFRLRHGSVLFDISVPSCGNSKVGNTVREGSADLRGSLADIVPLQQQDLETFNLHILAYRP